MYARTWARRVLHEFEITHPRVEQILSAIWMTYHHTKTPPDSAALDFMRSRVEWFLRISDTQEAGDNLWKRFKDVVKRWEDDGDPMYYTIFTCTYGKTLCSIWYQPELPNIR